MANRERGNGLGISSNRNRSELQVEEMWRHLKCRLRKVSARVYSTSFFLFRSITFFIHVYRSSFSPYILFNVYIYPSFPPLSPFIGELNVALYIYGREWSDCYCVYRVPVPQRDGLQIGWGVAQHVTFIKRVSESFVRDAYYARVGKSSPNALPTATLTLSLSPAPYFSAPSCSLSLLDLAGACRLGRARMWWIYTNCYISYV